MLNVFAMTGTFHKTNYLMHKQTNRMSVAMRSIELLMDYESIG